MFQKKSFLEYLKEILNDLNLLIAESDRSIPSNSRQLR